MRQRIVAILSVAWLVSTAAPSMVSAQGAIGAEALAQRVAVLENELSALRERAVQVPTMGETIQHLSARLAALEEELGLLARQEQAIPDAMGVLDELQARMRTLEAELEGLRTQLAHLEQAWEPASARAAGPVTHENGFAWATADGRNAIRLSGYMQAHHRLVLADGDIEESMFLLRRARLDVSGHVGSEKMRYKLLLSALREPALLDFYADYALSESLAVRFGQYKTPLTRSFITSSTQLAFVERSLTIDAFRYDWDVQLGMHGTLADERLGFYVGLGNGAGPNQPDDNLQVALTARADAVILGQRFAPAYGDIARTATPTLMVGTGLVYDASSMPGSVGEISVDNDADGDGDGDDVRVLSASIDAAFRYRGLEVVVEAVGRREDTRAIFDLAGNAALRAAVGVRRTHLGVVGQITQVLPRNILIGGRVGYAQLPFLGLAGRPIGRSAAEHVLELDALAQLYRGDRRMLSVMYSMHDYGGTTDPTIDLAHRVIMEAQIVF